MSTRTMTRTTTRTMMAATAVMALVAAPSGAQQHQHGQDDQDARAGMMESCPMMQGMHGHMMQGMDREGMQGRMMQGMDREGMQGRMMGGGMMGMMGMMGGAMHTSPAMLLQASDELELTASQTADLERLKDEGQAEHMEHMQAACAAHGQATTALEGDAPDMDAYASALREAADHMVTGHVAMTRNALEARDLLTPEQREKLEGMHDGMGPGGA